jgi:hypothetical protein
MKKLLVVSDKIVEEIMERVGKELCFEEVVTSPHANALERFLTEAPSHVLVCEYDERPGELGRKSPGLQSWDDISAAASGEKLVRAGLAFYNYADYIRVPFLITDLRKILQGEV